MHTKWMPVLISLLALCELNSPCEAAFTAHDLFPLTNPGNGFTQVFPTGNRPAGGGVVGGQGAHGDNFSHAFLWTSSAAPIDLNPAGFTNSYIWAADSAHQVGYAANNRTGFGHPFLWSGTRASAVDLTPTGYDFGVAYAASDARQVGSLTGGPNGFDEHAVVWNGTASSFVDINPAGFVTSKAIGLDATHEVGSGGGSSTGNAEHALLWTDGQGAVDLHPSGFLTSEGSAVRDGREAGFGYVAAGGNPQALLWTGSSSAAAVLPPAGFDGSVAKDVTLTSVAGYAFTPGFVSHAAYWTDSAESFVDLHLLLGEGFVDSQAYSIGADGTIFGTARDSNNVYHAVSWTPSLAALRSDFNGDGKVDADDLAIWSEGFGTSGGAFFGPGDADGDGSVDGADFLIWQRELSVAPVSSGHFRPVPEPSCCFLLTVGTLLLLKSFRERFPADGKPILPATELRASR